MADRILQNFIDGRFVDTVDGQTTSLIDPSTGEVFAAAPLSTEADVDVAMKAAATAFEAWRDTTPSERGRALLRIAAEVHNADVLSHIADLLRHPAPLRWVLLSRSDPRLHLQRLRVQGELADIRAADLAFTEDEAGTLMDKAGVTLAPPQNRRLLDRTEGWVRKEGHL